MAEVIIGTTIAGTATDPTGTGLQRHLIWATNDAAWWLFYVNSATNTVVKSYRSPDGVTWTAKTDSGAFASSATHTSHGRNVGVAYKSISSNDVVHLIAFTTGATNQINQHARATLSGGAITWGSWATLDGGQVTLASLDPVGCVTGIDSNNFVMDVSGLNVSSGDPSVYLSTNADLGSSWSAGFGAGVTLEVVTAGTNVHGLLDIGGGSLLALYENASGTEPNSMTNVRSATSADSGLVGTPGNVFTAFTAEDPNNFGAVDVSTTDIHCVVASGSTYQHKRYNGSNWTTVSGATIPSQTRKANSNIFLATDRTNVWLFVIDSDAANTVRWTKWISAQNTWTPWFAFETTTKTRNFISGWPYAVSGKFGLIWTETNGSNFDVAYESFDTTVAYLAQNDYRWRNDDGSESAATWVSSVDVDFAAPVGSNLRLRVQLAAAGDPASIQYQLEFKKSGGAYAAVATGSGNIRMYDSANIAAGGTTATTAQFTESQTFQAGEISDDTNPLPAINLAADTYTELEWAVTINSAAAVGDVYQFRVTNNGAALDNYVTTPQLVVEPPRWLSALKG